MGVMRRVFCCRVAFKSGHPQFVWWRGSIRALSRFGPARPHIARFKVFSRLIWPSARPLLHCISIDLPPGRPSFITRVLVIALLTASMSLFRVRANRTMGARSVSIASSIQAESGSALRPRKMPLNLIARRRIVVKAGEPALRASTFLACSAVSFPLGFMQSAAAMTGDIACPVSGSCTGSRIWGSTMGPPCSCFSALRHPAKSRCKFDRLPSYPGSWIRENSAFPLRMPFAQLCFR